MKNITIILSIFTVILIQSCGSSSSERANSMDDYVPEFVLTDSLVVDHLGPLQILDHDKASNQYLMYNYQKKILLVVNGNGEILVEANRAGEGPDSYQSNNFFRALFLDDGNISIFTLTHQYIYNNQLKLINRLELTASPYTNLMTTSNAVQAIGEYLFIFGVAEDELTGFTLENRGTFLWQLPLLKVFEPSSGKLIHQSEMPENLSVRKNPGTYIDVSPYFHVKNDSAYLLFPPSPEVYVMTWPELTVLDTIDLRPELGYSQMQPANPIDNFGPFFEELAGSKYDGMFISGEYMVTRYLTEAPRDEVNQLPRNVVGNEAFQKIQRSKKRVYQIFKGKNKVSEGIREHYITFLDDLAYSKTKPDEEFEERDEVYFYFYELK